MDPLGLTAVSTSSLERVRDGIRSGRLGTPVTRAGLVGLGVRGQLDALVETLAGHSREACCSILDAVLAERARHARPAPELVWTGPETAGATARDTAVVLRELFESARRRVVLAGYSFSHARDVLAPLHATMVAHGVEVHLFVDVAQPQTPPDDVEAYGRAVLAAFRAANWPFGPPEPTLYCDRRSLRPGHGGVYCSLHAKCVAVDARRAYVSSANFTARGQARNIETGVLIADPTFAAQLERQWLSLIQGGFVVRLAGRTEAG